MPLTIREEQCHHFAGDNPLGLVLDTETIVIAVFERTKRNGESLSIDSFTSNMNTNDESVARLGYTTVVCLLEKIAAPRLEGMGALIGVCTASVAELREIRSTPILPAGPKEVRSIEILDKVEPDDYPSHATLGYSDLAALGVSPKKIGTIRAAIRLELSKVFSSIRPYDSIDWVNREPI